MTDTPTFCFQQTMTLTPKLATTTNGNTVLSDGNTVAGVKCRLQPEDSRKRMLEGGINIEYDSIIFCGPNVVVSTGYIIVVGTRTFTVQGVVSQGTQPNVFQKKILVLERKI